MAARNLFQNLWIVLVSVFATVPFFSLVIGLPSDSPSTIMIRSA